MEIEMTRHPLPSQLKRAAVCLLLLTSLIAGGLPHARAAQGIPVPQPYLNETKINEIPETYELELYTQHFITQKKRGPKVAIELKSSRPDILEIRGQKAVGRKADANPVLLSVFTISGRTKLLSRVYQVRVTLPPKRRVAKIDFDGVGAAIKPDKAVIITATPKNEAGATVDEKVEWRIVSDGGSTFDKVLGDRQMVIILKSAAARPAPIVFAAKLNGYEQTGLLNVEGAQPDNSSGGNKPLRVSGLVLGAGGPVRDVTVALEDTPEGKSPPSARTVKTDENGSFAFDKVEPKKKYTLRATGDNLLFTPAHHSFELNESKSVTFSAAPVPAPEPITKLVDAQLDPVDYRMASDLYGNVTNRQYSVRKLQLFNKLADLRNGSFVGDSIVVYADSIKVPVNLEVKYIGPENIGAEADGKKLKVDKSRRGWHPLELAVAAPDLHKPLDAAAWEEWRTKWAYRRKEIDPVRFKSKLADPDTPTGLMLSQDLACEQNPIYYTPFTLDQMMSTANRREAREWRTILTTATSGSLTVASFLGTILFPGGTSDLPLILDKTNNLLLPSYKELLPSTRDANQQNLTREALRTVETIPFKQSVQKMAFFPKQPWKNGRYEYRISHICQEPIKVEAVVAKAGDSLPIHTLGGRVTDAAGEPVADATVELGGAFIAPRQLTTDANGRYAFTQLTPGDYTLRAYPPDTACRISSAVKSASVTDKSSEVDVPLPPLRFDIRGLVKKKGAGGAGVKGAKVKLVKDGKAVATSPETGDDGSFVFACQEVGDYKLEVTLPGGAAGPKRDVELTEEDVTDADVEIEETKEAGGDGGKGTKGELHHAPAGGAGEDSDEFEEGTPRPVTESGPAPATQREPARATRRRPQTRWPRG
jgi:hypothetical protein